MPLREFIAKKGMEVNVENLLSWQSVAVGFINSDGIDESLMIQMMCWPPAGNSPAG